MKIGRNEPCLCGSGKKYKKCCMGKDKKNHDEMKKKISEDISKHLLPHSSDLNYPDSFNTKEEIINFYKSAGYIVDIEEIEHGSEDLPDSLEVNLICRHGFSECSETLEFIDGKWGYIASGEGNICSACEFIREYKFVPACPRCGTMLPTLSEPERLRFYKDGIDDYLGSAVCPKCGSSFLTPIEH